MKTLCDVCKKAGAVCPMFPSVTDSCEEFETTIAHMRPAVELMAEGMRRQNGLSEKRRRFLFMIHVILSCASESDA